MKGEKVMKEKVFILSASRYSFTDESTGEIRKGMTVFYVNDIKPVAPTDTVKGTVPVKANFPYEMFNTLGDVPGYHSIEYTQTANSRGQLRFVYNGISKA